MSYVQSISDIEANAFALLDVAHGSDMHRVAALKLIKGGRVFYPIQYSDGLAFVPSKFIGYRNNTVSKHEQVKQAESRDGRDTNVAIQNILGIAVEDTDLEKRLEAYCQSLGVDLENHKHKFWRVEAAKRFTAPAGSSINDIDAADFENSDPEYKQRMAGSYTRDPMVRRLVLKRAKGNCEYGFNRSLGSCTTFLKSDGKPYLETHHIIKLSEQGRDTPLNVIGLCANHHREAHFGQNWKALQDEFLQIISEKMSK